MSFKSDSDQAVGFVSSGIDSVVFPEVVEDPPTFSDVAEEVALPLLEAFPVLLEAPPWEPQETRPMQTEARVNTSHFLFIFEPLKYGVILKQFLKGMNFFLKPPQENRDRIYDYKAEVAARSF